MVSTRVKQLVLLVNSLVNTAGLSRCVLRATAFSNEALGLY